MAKTQMWDLVLINPSFSLYISYVGLKSTSHYLSYPFLKKQKAKQGLENQKTHSNPGFTMYSLATFNLEICFFIL